MERIIAAFEHGAQSAESPIAIDGDCPFGDSEPGLREYWLDGFYIVRSASIRDGRNRIVERPTEQTVVAL
ncbi:hypothetical protein Q4F19_17900 [Sphingomonas sp. BIUV-7]|uniref:Uncharacterized protein n=1 Tax=Sphingomonas natans TaxID=3063330 RepID=A0ABT8YF17_9SPHN|nr:hypothetical protein [Sphingomonas sp. BIUV-7]MDO6416264.1 hypothetical protein [Sphingomonas sp. BIUV-7]